MLVKQGKRKANGGPLSASEYQSKVGFCILLDWIVSIKYKNLQVLS